MFLSRVVARSAAAVRATALSRCISTSRPALADAVFKHIDTAENNASTAFDFNEENKAVVARILSKYPVNRKQSGVIPLLHLAQEQHGGWLPLAAMNRIAEVCEVAPMRVYEVATFYTMFNRTKIGKYHVLVCVTTPCMLCGSDSILGRLEEHLGISLNETTSDGMITLGEMECMGCCSTAPMIAVADYSKAPKHFAYDYYEDLTVERAVEIVDMLRRGEQPPVGNQGKRSKAMPAHGKTSLLFKSPPGPYCRDLDKA